MSPEFLLTALIVVVSPGTGALFTLATGLTQGGRASLVAAFGCTLGILPHLAAAIGGLAVVLQASALAFELLRYAGIAYLLYMAWQTLREGGALKLDERGADRPAFKIVLHAVAINLLNPKLSIFFLAFLPQFIAASDPHPLTTMSLLSGVFMAMTFFVFAGYGLFAAAIRDRIVSRPAVMTWMRRSFAAGFVLLGAKLALAER